jgi:quercetin dioxygenase-like cupin family protein
MIATMQNYAVVQDIGGLIASIQPESIVSRTVYSDSQINVVIFGFDTGQALSEHTASQPATIQILQGEATITVVEDSLEATVGTWIHMPPNTKHSVVAETPLILLLTLLKTPSPEH